MTDDLMAPEPNEVGRPTVITPETVQKLVDVFKLGVKDQAACAYAGISRQTFYKHLQDDTEFSDKIEAARGYAVIAARQVVVRDIVEKNNVDTAKWYLEKHDVKQEVGVQQNTQVNVFNQLKEKYTIKDPIVEVTTTDNIGEEKKTDATTGL